MAGLEVRNGRYNLILRFGGKRFVRSLETNDEDTALAKKLRVEENIKLVESGRLTIPDGADVITFLLSDGKLNTKPVVTASLTLPELFKEFWEAMSADSHEEGAIKMMKIHQRHLERVLGKRLRGKQFATNRVMVFWLALDRERRRSVDRHDEQCERVSPKVCEDLLAISRPPLIAGRCCQNKQHKSSWWLPIILLCGKELQHMDGVVTDRE